MKGKVLVAAMALILPLLAACGGGGGSGGADSDSGQNQLPPDPGESGNVTIPGVDANNNGVRDDVELALHRLHANDAADRAVMLLGAKALQEAVLAGVPGTQSDSDVVADRVSLAVDCLYRLRQLSPRKALAELNILVLNTIDRVLAYQAYDQSRDGTIQRPVQASDQDCAEFAQ